MALENIFYNALAVNLKSDYQALQKLKKKFGTWEAAWKSSADKSNADPKKLWDELLSLRVQLFLDTDVGYPPLLKEIPLPPFGIYLRGCLPENDAICLSIVGTRKMTPEGGDLAYEFGKFLAGQNIVIVSGLALGIDSSAHKGALQTGRTLAVLATGADNPYPHTNKKLAEEIIEKNGAILSEYPPGSVPFPYRFLERNRIVSGLSRATIVIEAPENSGALVTARFALDQNREVFAIPGPAGHFSYKGSHALIREGARLASNPKEILEDLNLLPAQKSIFSGGPEKSSVLYAIESSGPIEFDGIIELTKLDTSLVNRALSSLLIEEKIKETAHGYQIA